MPNERVEVSHRLHRATGDMAHHVDLFGDTLAERHGYKSLNGMDAIHYYLVQKHNWFPAQVRSLCTEDLRFLLEEEMAGWTVPPDKKLSTKAK